MPVSYTHLDVYKRQLLILFGAGYSFAFFCTGMLPALGIYTQQWVTQANGFLLNFTVAMRYSSVDKPEDYSRDRVCLLYTYRCV